ncbi:unnamed protein product [Paramecium primaurelia]|uniref:Uncharacterized protein n=1 Tax=Paramecium primaurelia TaxID=5886 RepID=A0A8S1QGH1_PARPR|nr:unnamed protein product [Paramecium primaurelia]
MQQFHQNSLSPLIIIGDVDNLEEDLKSKHTPEKSPSYLDFKNKKQENTEKKENNLMIKKFNQHASDFTDLLYLWNDYLRNKFEKNNRLQ